MGVVVDVTSPVFSAEMALVLRTTKYTEYSKIGPELLDGGSHES